jgi:hypothetical protein
MPEHFWYSIVDEILQVIAWDTLTLYFIPYTLTKTTTITNNHTNTN